LTQERAWPSGGLLRFRSARVGNTVMLGGRVRTRAQRDAVVAAAWQGHAVMAVIDELEITG